MDSAADITRQNFNTNDTINNINVSNLCLCCVQKFFQNIN